ncbi:MAG: hypothetical protein M1820_009361 [Bogoriella megaspora]|nr:MAG: hypothetical protein M1820_009361 [Bogoriella megaspora]
MAAHASSRVVQTQQDKSGLDDTRDLLFTDPSDFSFVSEKYNEISIFPQSADTRENTSAVLPNGLTIVCGDSIFEPFENKGTFIEPKSGIVISQGWNRSYSPSVCPSGLDHLDTFILSQENFENSKAHKEGTAFLMLCENSIRQTLLRHAGTEHQSAASLGSLRDLGELRIGDSMMFSPLGYFGPLSGRILQALIHLTNGNWDGPFQTEFYASDEGEWDNYTLLPSRYNHDRRCRSSAACYRLYALSQWISVEDPALVVHHGMVGYTEENAPGWWPNDCSSCTKDYIRLNENYGARRFLCWDEHGRSIDMDGCHVVASRYPNQKLDRRQVQPSSLTRPAPWLMESSTRLATHTNVPTPEELSTKGIARDNFNRCIAHNPSNVSECADRAADYFWLWYITSWDDYLNAIRESTENEIRNLSHYREMVNAMTLPKEHTSDLVASKYERSIAGYPAALDEHWLSFSKDHDEERAWYEAWRSKIGDADHSSQKRSILQHDLESSGHRTSGSQRLGGSNGSAEHQRQSIRRRDEYDEAEDRCEKMFHGDAEEICEDIVDLAEDAHDDRLRRRGLMAGRLDDDLLGLGPVATGELNDPGDDWPQSKRSVDHQKQPVRRRDQLTHDQRENLNNERDLDLDDVVEDVWDGLKEGVAKGADYVACELRHDDDYCEDIASVSTSVVVVTTVVGDA